MNIIERPANTNNFGRRKRGASPIFLVLHDTAGSLESAISWFENKMSGVSSHYVIGLQGEIYRMVPEDRCAWHAGESAFMGYTGINDWSIGIEIVDLDDKDPYPEAQLGALIELSEDILTRYKIPLNRCIGHADVAVPHGRKQDPGIDFNWESFLITLGARLAAKHFE